MHGPACSNTPPPHRPVLLLPLPLTPWRPSLRTERREWLSLDRIWRPWHDGAPALYELRRQLLWREARLARARAEAPAAAPADGAAAPAERTAARAAAGEAAEAAALATAIDCLSGAGRSVPPPPPQPPQPVAASGSALVHTASGAARVGGGVGAPSEGRGGARVAPVGPSGRGAEEILRQWATASDEDVHWARTLLQERHPPPPSAY